MQNLHAYSGGTVLESHPVIYSPRGCYRVRRHSNGIFTCEAGIHDESIKVNRKMVKLNFDTVLVCQCLILIFRFPPGEAEQEEIDI